MTDLSMACGPPKAPREYAPVAGVSGLSNDKLLRGEKNPPLACSLLLAFTETEEYGMIVQGRENEKAFFFFA